MLKVKRHKEAALYLREAKSSRYTFHPLGV
jgi:hypothetical protein